VQTFIRTNDLGANIVTVAKLALELNLQSNDVKVAGPTDAKHAANKEYVDGKFTAATTDLTAALNAEIARAQAAEGVLTADLATEVARATAAEGVLTSAIATEKTRAETAEAGLTAAISAEEAARIAAVSAEATARTNADNALGVRIDNLTTSVSNDLAAEQAARIAADATLTSNLAAEVSRAQGAEATLTADLASEIARASAAESAEQTRALAAEADLQSQIDGYVASNDAALAAEISRATGRENSIEAALNAEITRATNAETVLTTDLAAEVSRATAAELALGVRIDTANTDLSTETAARIAGDNALSASLAAEVSRATAAELALGVRIDGVVDDLAAEVTRAMDAEAVLQQNIEAGLQGLEVKDSVKGRLDFSMAQNFNVSMLSGILKGDGSAMADLAGQPVVDGGRYLITAPVSAQGIWVAKASGAWEKAVDANATGELDAGCFTFVEDESAGWVLKADGVWSQFSGSGTYGVGNGLALNGTIFSLKADMGQFEFLTGGVFGIKAQGIAGSKIANNAIGFGHLDADVQRRMGKFDAEVFVTSGGQTDFVVADCPVEDLVVGEILVFVNGIKRRCKNFGGLGDFTVVRDGGVPKVRFDYEIPVDYEFSAVYGKKNA
jgi:hypothetical protein